MLTGPDELVAIAQAFYVLTEAGVEGPFSSSAVIRDSARRC